MDLSRITGFVISVILVAGCGSGLRVATDWNPERADVVRGWRTWTWLDPAVAPSSGSSGEPVPLYDSTESDSTGSASSGPAARDYDDLDDVRIREAITRNLEARGFSRSAPGRSADFLVAHQLVFEEHLVVRDTPYYAGWYGSTRPWYGPTYIDEVHTGVLVVDIVDPGSNELVWRGVAEAPALSRIDSPDRRRALIHEAVDEMFAELPFRRSAGAIPVESLAAPGS